MARKTINWDIGGGHLTITFTGEGSGTISIESTENPDFVSRSKTLEVETTSGEPYDYAFIHVTQRARELGWTVKDFNYTGTVQEVLLPKGLYRIQCWGAQGGDSTKYNATGSPGGYSDGELELTETTKLYIFVGGSGNYMGNGGWNGGGFSNGESSYDDGTEYGISYPASGGGASDVCTVTSGMNFVNGRTNRSQASLLSRFIVAGGGAGASSFYQSIVEEYTRNEDLISQGLRPEFSWQGTFFRQEYFTKYFKAGDVCHQQGTSDYEYYCYCVDSSGARLLETQDSSFVIPSGTNTIYVQYMNNDHILDGGCGISFYREVVETSTTTDYDTSDARQWGGGTSGGGTYGGKQTSAGYQGGFGYGGRQDRTNYRYCSGAGGGGWYGGGINYSDSNPYGNMNYSGGGSGFVNTAGATVPSGYTGLRLKNGRTVDGGTRFPAVGGGDETGHYGNGVVRITVKKLY